jgi:ubiquinone/menaquinone biosynthesis C-methylase UbiE
MMGWLDSQLLRELYVLPAISGPKSRGNWFLDIVSELGIRSDGDWLSLGCGRGDQEIYCIEQGLCSRLDAFDLSAEAIAIAHNKAEQKGLSGLHFDACDFTMRELPGDGYDVIIMSMSLHHVAEINKFLPRINRTLKSGGWLLVNEYVGPSQFQFTDTQMQIVREILALLPNRLRYDYVHNEVKRSYKRQPRSFWFRVDPSEAICSDQIEATLRRYFRVVVQRNYGGTLLNPLLEHIVGNFDSESESDTTILYLLAYLERCLIREGVLQNDFAVFAAQKKRVPVRLISLPYQLRDKTRAYVWRRRRS